MRISVLISVLILWLSKASQAKNQDFGFDDPKAFIFENTSPRQRPEKSRLSDLGRKLFLDKRLSSDGSVSCATCHLGSNQVMRGNRDAPSILNVALLSAYYWDGRAGSLEVQAAEAFVNPAEMAMPSHEAVVLKVQRIGEYGREFKDVFKVATPVSMANIGIAIAAYEKTLITTDSPFDQWAKGDKSAISPQAQRGFAKFIAMGCNMCHSGPNFSGPEMLSGTPFLQYFSAGSEDSLTIKYDLMADAGRKSFTGTEGDAHQFRVPSLRNIAMTAPYFHNGSVATLKEAIRVMAKVQINKDMNDEDVDDLAVFLESLTGKIP